MVSILEHHIKIPKWIDILSEVVLQTKIKMANSMDIFTYVLSVNGLIFFLSIVFYCFPPKKINRIYGYRTYRTMRNNEVWNFANHVFSITLLKYSGISLAVALLLTYIGDSLMSSWLPMALMIFTLLISIISTEKRLNEKFDDQGNRKAKNW